jgi:hypothetical protein
MSELVVSGPALGQDATLEPGHREQKVRIVLRVDGHEARVPLDGRH